MTSDETFLFFILDELSSLSDISHKKMFGSFGLYRGESFFGIISKDVLYLKTNNKTKPLFVKKGMKPFAPSKNQVLKNYYEVPPDVLEEREALVRWVEGALSGE